MKKESPQPGGDMLSDEICRLHNQIVQLGAENELLHEKLDVAEANLVGVYSQRNALAIAFAKAALAAGWPAGRGVDTNPKPGWDPEWLNVVYVDLPNGQQVSWHMSPMEVAMAMTLPEYAGEWDGTAIGRSPSWCLFEGGA